MSRLLRSRAWSVLALLAGITSLWPGDVLWLRLACAAGLAIGISQQLALLVISIRMRMLGTLRVRLSSATMLSAAVACWYLANSPRLPFLVVAGLLVVLAGLWWFCTALKDADVVQLQARNLPGVPEEPVNPPRWPYGWAAVVVCGFLVLGFVAATLSLPAVVFPVLAALTAAMLAVIRVQLARFTGYNRVVLDKLRAYRPALTMPYNGHAGFHIGLWSPYLERTGQPFTVVTTDALAFQRVAAKYTMPVIYARTGDLRAIRAMLPKTVRAALYVYSRNNDDFMKVRRRMTHVWLHHGDSDKEARFGGSQRPMTCSSWLGRQRSTDTPRMECTFRRRSSRFLVVRKSRTSRPRRPQSPPSTTRSCFMHRPGTPPTTRTTTPPFLLAQLSCPPYSRGMQQ